MPHSSSISLKNPESSFTQDDDDHSIKDKKEAESNVPCSDKSVEPSCNKESKENNDIEKDIAEIDGSTNNLGLYMNFKRKLSKTTFK